MIITNSYKHLHLCNILWYNALKGITEKPEHNTTLNSFDTETESEDIMEILIEYTYPNTDDELKGCNEIHSFDVFKFDTSITHYNKDRLQMLINTLIREYIPKGATINRVQVNDIGK